MQTRVDGKMVGIGAVVCFKSDVEQSGTIAKIERTMHGDRLTLTTTRDGGFHGDYIGGADRTTVMARDCWVE